jgi:hypothetical protein
MPRMEPNAAAQLVQVHPSWSDWITVGAIVLGPILALFAQRLLDWMREKRSVRLNLYLTVMSYRAIWIHLDSLKALNSIDAVFDRKKDQPIREAWGAVIAHASTPRPDWNTDQEAARRWDSRLLDLRSDLYQLLGKAVGYDHSVDYIKTHMYYPDYHSNNELDWLFIRSQLTKVLTDHGIKVIVGQ